MSVTLNCDLGENDPGENHAAEPGPDAQIMPHIDAANIACGFHAGGPQQMHQTLRLAAEHRLQVGAHPSYPDREGFGRRAMQLSEAELTACIQYQVSALAGMANLHGLRVSYVKPHGALYNVMMQDEGLLDTVLEAVAAIGGLKLMIQATPAAAQHRALATKHNVSLLMEGFADRAYSDAGWLVPRTEQGALLSKEAMLAQTLSLLTSGTVNSQSGKALALQVDSICIHGDNPIVLENIAELRALFTRV